jgi:hypothetical protein
MFFQIRSRIGGRKPVAFFQKVQDIIGRDTRRFDFG